MWREPLEDEDIINEYNNAQSNNKKVDITNSKPTGNSIWTAKYWSKKII